MNRAALILSIAAMVLTASAVPITQDQSSDNVLRINIDGGDLLGQVLSLVLDI